MACEVTCHVEYKVKSKGAREADKCKSARHWLGGDLGLIARIRENGCLDSTKIQV